MDAEPQQAAQGPQCEDFGSAGWPASCSWSVRREPSIGMAHRRVVVPERHALPGLTDAMPWRGTTSAMTTARRRVSFTNRLYPTRWTRSGAPGSRQ